MAESAADRKRSVPEEGPSGGVGAAGRVLLLCVGLLVVGVAGYFAFRGLWVRYVFAHVGGLAIIGLLGCWAGVVAGKKGHGFWRGFLLAFVPPVVIGAVATLMVHLLGGRGCGAVVSLPLAIAVVVFYYFARRKDVAAAPL